MNRTVGNWISFSTIIAFVLSLIYCRTNYTIPFLPLMFGVGFTLMNACMGRTGSITIYLVTILLWIRSAFLPVYGLLTGYYDGLENLTPACILTIYETLVCFIVLILIYKNKSAYKTEREERYLAGTKEIYIIYILFALAIFVTIGRNMQLFDFAIKSVGVYEREDEIVDPRTMLIRQIVSTGLLFAFFVIVERCRRKYSINSKRKYITYSIFCAVFLVMIIVGERRTSQIYKAFASIWLLINVFPSNKKRIVLFISSAALFVLVMMTLYKQFNAFMYGSYSEAIENSNMGSGLSAGVIDAYFYGVGTIAKNLSYANVANLGFDNFVYDILRNCFGVNFFVRDTGMLLTSQAYNYYLYGGDQLTGYLLSSVGYGYIYWGPIFAPVMTCANILILSFFEKRMKGCKSIEFCYIWAFVYMRFGFGFLGSLPPLINLVTRYLVLNGLVYFVAIRIKKNV